MAEPQVNPNALAAPAEGFGQTVTFAFDPTGSAPKVQPVQRRAPTVGIQGNLSRGEMQNPNAAAAAASQVKPDPTAALLMKVGKDILQKKVDEARSAEYVKGMQASMNGQALEEIKAETPWYAKIFGDTPMIEGARAYEAQDVVNKTLAQATRDMDKLKKLSPQEATQHFNGLIQSATNTGDSARDAIVTKAMLDQMPALMKAQAKANYEYGQETARKNMGQSILSGGAALQELGELYAGDKISPADMKARTTQYLMSVIPPDGINEENYGKTLTAAIQQMAINGQFHAVTAIRDSGALQALNPEQSKQVEAAILTQANRHKDRYASKFVREMAELKSDAQFLPNGMTPADITTRAQKMNDAYKKLTGSPVDLYTSDEVANLATASLNDLKRQAQKAADREQVLSDRNATESQKAVALAEKADAIERAVRTGEVTKLKTFTKATDDEIDQAFIKVVSDPQANGSFIMNQAFIRSGYANNVLKQEYQSALREAEGQGVPTDNWFREVQRFEGMVQSAGGYAFASAYYGDYAPKLMRASRMLNGNVLNNPNADRIFTASMSRDSWNKPQPLDKKQQKELVKNVASKASGMPIPRWLGGRVQPRAASLETLADIAEVNVEDWRGAGLSDSEAMAVGVQQAIVTGRVELLGGFAIQNADYRPGGKPPTPLRELMGGDPNGSTYIAIPSGAEDEYFEGFLFDALKVPKDIGSHMLSRTADAGGTQQFVFTAVDKDGITRPYRFTAKELQTYAGARALKDTKPRDKPLLAFGPQITYSAHATPVPSPYVSAEEQARFRAEQRRKTQPKQ